MTRDKSSERGLDRVEELTEARILCEIDSSGLPIYPSSPGLRLIRRAFFDPMAAGGDDERDKRDQID